MHIDCEAFFELRTSCTRGHPYKLFKHHSSISVRSNFFAERVINAWNGLPANRIDFSSYPTFQSSLQHCFNCQVNYKRSFCLVVPAICTDCILRVVLPHVIMANK